MKSWIRDMKRVCKKHGLTEYNSPTTGSSRCKKCMVEAVTLKRRRLKAEAIKYKGGKCVQCGYNKYQGALEFHHLDPTKKDFSFSARIIKWEHLKIELDKCILVCANCHREIHGLVA